MAAEVLSVNNNQYQVESFNFNNFNTPSQYTSNGAQEQEVSSQTLDTILSKLDNLSNELTSIKQDNLSNSNKLDNQVIEALTSLNNHSKQFDNITKTFEQKLIAYSLKIASKIINQEVQENSNQIALNFAQELILKLKDATKISVHINPKDYEYLQTHLDLSPTIELVKDPNVSPAGIVISSDIGNFDSTIESKLDTLTQSIETLY
jgi:flagellar assembly protein FliH